MFSALQFHIHTYTYYYFPWARVFAMLLYIIILYYISSFRLPKHIISCFFSFPMFFPSSCSESFPLFYLWYYIFRFSFIFIFSSFSSFLVYILHRVSFKKLLHIFIYIYYIIHIAILYHFSHANTFPQHIFPLCPLQQWVTVWDEKGEHMVVVPYKTDIYFFIYILLHMPMFYAMPFSCHDM